jgi:splicing factor 45
VLVDLIPCSHDREPVHYSRLIAHLSALGSAIPASLRFQPTRRPQLSAQKPKAKQPLPKTAPVPAPAASATTSLADWAANEDDDVNGFYVGEKRPRGGRKKRKKNRESQTAFQNWDDIYDPSRPNNYEEYKNSDEKIAEVREWKDRLYAHRMARSPSRDSDSEGYSRPMNRMFHSPLDMDPLAEQTIGQFAPPGSFAPPPNLNDIPPPPEEYAPPEPSAPVPDDPSGEDAFARRARMAANQGDVPMPDYMPPPPPPEESSAPVPDAPTESAAPPPRPFDDAQPDTATISRAPVRYTLPPPPEDIPASEEELEAAFAKEKTAEEDGEAGGQRSLRPGQKGFAERFLAKYGWKKGSGLGADESGIAKPLQVKVEKAKKRPDSEGGGFSTPAGRGKIIGGARKKEDEGKFGSMSEVIVLEGMLAGMDLDAELQGEQGGLMQEIGEECSEKVRVFDSVGFTLLTWSSMVVLNESSSPADLVLCLSSSPTNYRPSA